MVMANAKTSFGTDKIFIGGGSAGAQLAATTILYVRDSLHAADKVIGVGLHNGLLIWVKHLLTAMRPTALRI
jgi:hypothetical protein